MNNNGRRPPFKSLRPYRFTNKEMKAQKDNLRHRSFSYYSGMATAFSKDKTAALRKALGMNLRDINSLRTDAAVTAFRRMPPLEQIILSYQAKRLQEVLPNVGHQEAVILLAAIGQYFAQHPEYFDYELRTKS